MKKVLFVCSGNTCRSPMAEAIFKKLLNNENNSEYTATSAGLFTSEGLPASEHAIKAMLKMGIDLSGHSSQAITQSLMAEADLILTMTKDHLSYLIKLYPEKRDRIFTIGEFVGYPDWEITDPYGMNQQTYQKSSREIKEILNLVIKILMNDRSVI